MENDVGKLNLQALAKFEGVPEAVWTSAENEVAITKCMETLKRNETLSGLEPRVKNAASCTDDGYGRKGVLGRKRDPKTPLVIKPTFK